MPFLLIRVACHGWPDQGWGHLRLTAPFSFLEYQLMQFRLFALTAERLIGLTQPNYYRCRFIATDSTSVSPDAYRAELP